MKELPVIRALFLAIGFLALTTASLGAEQTSEVCRIALVPNPYSELAVLFLTTLRPPSFMTPEVGGSAGT